MANQLDERIIITDEDIDWVEKILDNITFDECRRKIIKNMSNIEIQAFPGAGKTTVLIAKLAILARKWTFSDKGICVLSHTNIARKEIEERLGNTDVGKKLLMYPHFIGTFHSFFDTFVSLPWIRSHGIKVKIIDSEIVKKIRWSKLSYNTRIFLENKRLDYECCVAIELPLKIKIGTISSNTSTYSKVLGVVKESLSRGEFTFEEILLYAQEALNSCQTLSNYISNRFQFLSIDEAQDTSNEQWKLINLAFQIESTTTRQYYGDRNQAIFNTYNFDDSISFTPIGEILTMPNSKRFGPKIASIANRIALTNEKMEGDSTVYNNLSDSQTIFLFNKNNPKLLIDSYAKLIHACFTDEEILIENRNGCYVIGMVHKDKNTNVDHKPVSVKDYWNEYDANYAKRDFKPISFIDYFRLGSQEFKETGELNNLIDWILDGFRQYLNNYYEEKISLNSNAFKTLLNELSETQKLDFRKSLFSLMKMDISTEKNWKEVTKLIISIIDKIFKLQDSFDSFLEWKSQDYSIVSEEKKNVLKYIDEITQRQLQINFGSIHSVKGCTHLATMVVETFWYEPNIKSLLPFLCDNLEKNNTSKRIKTRMKCHYVAFTRAQAILCIALPKENVTNDQIIVLKNNGWRVVDITLA